MSNFKKELMSLINAHSKETDSDTPDYILADYLVSCLEAFNKTTNARDLWVNVVIQARAERAKGVVHRA